MHDVVPTKSSHDFGLTKKNRIRKRRDFLRVQRAGVRAQGSFVVLIAKKIQSDREGRVGLTVSKAVGKAHVRNLVKRRLRHIIRTNRSLFIQCDLVVLAQPSAASASFEDLQRDLLHVAEILLRKMTSKTNRATSSSRNPSQS